MGVDSKAGGQEPQQGGSGAGKETVQQQQQPGQGGTKGCHRQATSAAAAPRVDDVKGAVVFNRYYHLFDQQELQGLVLQVPGVAVVECFYDRSNWCIVLEASR